MILGLEPADFDLTMSNFEIFRTKVFEASQLVMKLQSANLGMHGQALQIGAVGVVNPAMSGFNQLGQYNSSSSSSQLNSSMITSSAGNRSGSQNTSSSLVNISNNTI